MHTSSLPSSPASDSCLGAEHLKQESLRLKLWAPHWKIKTLLDTWPSTKLSVSVTSTFSILSVHACTIEPTYPNAKPILRCFWLSFWGLLWNWVLQCCSIHILKDEDTLKREPLTILQYDPGEDFVNLTWASTFGLQFSQIWVTGRVSGSYR